MLHTSERPATLDEIIGNENLVKSLKQQLQNEDRPHCYMFEGPSGSGKCITGDSLVLTENGISPIENIIDNYGYKKNKLVLSTKDGTDTSSHFYKEKVNKTIKITLKNGVSIEGTVNHPLYVCSDKGFIWKPLSEINYNDIIVLKNNTQLYGNKKYLKYVYKPSSKVTRYKTQKVETTCDFTLGLLYGYLIANACFYKNTFIFTSNNIRIGDSLINIMYDKFGVIVKRKKYESSGAFVYSLRHAPTMKALIEWYGEEWKTARYKKIPKCILQGTKEAQIGFLIGMFECDAYYTKFSLELSTASNFIANGVYTLLANMGIISFISQEYLKKYDWTYYTVHLDRISYEKLYYGYESLKYVFSTQKNSNPNKRTWDIPARAIEEYRDWAKTNIDSSGKFYTTREIASNMSKVKTSISRGRFSSGAIEEFLNAKVSNNLFLYEIAEKINSGYLLYKPKNIEYKNEEVDVYDFTIPVSKNFVANGIINHNTTIAHITSNMLGANELDIHEYNLADTRGIDTAREIIDKMYMSPLGNSTVFIIDEIHQSTRAFQEALLKPTEDVPRHVYFFLCTTEPSKIITTLKRRFTQYTTQYVKEIDIFTYIHTVAKKYKIVLTKAVIQAITDNAQGSVAKALVLLDKVRDLDEKTQLQLLDADEEHVTDIRKLCTALLENAKWGKISNILQKLDEPPETIRFTVLHYMGQVLLNSKKQEQQMQSAKIIESFSEPFNTKPELVYACFTITL